MKNRMDKEKEIIKILKQMSGKYSMYEIFTDWVRCGALAMSNSCNLFHGKIWKEREQMYFDTLRKYNPDEQTMLVKMLSYMAETLGEEMRDVLGSIYTKTGMGSKAAGQFLTPYQLSELCAELIIPEPDPDGKIRINEPTCGAGGMIIAKTSELSRKSGVAYGSLYTSLADSKRERELRAEELTRICMVLKVNPMDFAEEKDMEEVK